VPARIDLFLNEAEKMKYRNEGEEKLFPKMKLCALRHFSDNCSTQILKTLWRAQRKFEDY
jgi:hypothetical protein